MRGCRGLQGTPQLAAAWYPSTTNLIDAPMCLAIVWWALIWTSGCKSLGVLLFRHGQWALGGGYPPRASSLVSIPRCRIPEADRTWGRPLGWVWPKYSVGGSPNLEMTHRAVITPTARTATPYLKQTREKGRGRQWLDWSRTFGPFFPIGCWIGHAVCVGRPTPILKDIERMSSSATSLGHRAQFLMNDGPPKEKRAFSERFG